MEPKKNNYLSHYGVLGMKWGVRRARRKENKLNRLNKKVDDWNLRSTLALYESENVSAEAKKKGPVAYGRAFARIHSLENQAKQTAKYAEFGRKRVSSYIKKLSKNYIVAYDVTSRTYSIRERNPKY